MSRLFVAVACACAPLKSHNSCVSLQQQLFAGMSCVVIEVDGEVRRVELDDDPVRRIDSLRALIGGYVRILVLKERLRLVVCHRASLKLGSTIKNGVAERLSSLAHFGKPGAVNVGIRGRAIIVSMDTMGGIESVGDDVESAARRVAEEFAEARRKLL